MREVELEQWEISHIKLALEAQIKALEGHARVMDQCAETGGNPMVSPEGARVMAQNHRSIAHGLRGLVKLLDECDSVFVQTEEPQGSESEG